MKDLLLKFSIGLLFGFFVSVGTAKAGCGYSLKAIGSTEICEGDSVTIRFSEHSQCDSRGYPKRWFRDGIVISDVPEFDNNSELVVHIAGTYTVKLVHYVVPFANNLSLTITIHSAQELQEPLFTEELGLLSAYYDTGFSYQWLLNGIEIDGATADTLRIDEVGMYQLMLTDVGGCNSYSSKPMSISSHHLAMLNPNAPVLYPIPNNGEFTLRYTFPRGSVGGVEVFDAMGRQVDIVRLEGEYDEWQFRNSALVPGMYSYRVSVDGLTVQVGWMVVTR